MINSFSKLRTQINFNKTNNNLIKSLGNFSYKNDLNFNITNPINNQNENNNGNGNGNGYLQNYHQTPNLLQSGNNKNSINNFNKYKLMNNTNTFNDFK